MEIKSIMHSVVRSLMPTDGLGTAGRAFEEAGVTVLPVRDGDGRVTGTVRLYDVNEAIKRSTGNPRSAAVETVMSRDTLTCLDSEDVHELAQKAERMGVTHAMIMNDLGEVKGIADLSPYMVGESDRNNGQETEQNEQNERNRDDNKQQDHDDDALDEALRETFPASDPISPP